MHCWTKKSYHDVAISQSFGPASERATVQTLKSITLKHNASLRMKQTKMGSEIKADEKRFKRAYERSYEIKSTQTQLLLANNSALNVAHL